MIATTYGLGPFYPKITEPDGEVWLHSMPFDSEDKAQEYALRIVQKVQRVMHDIFEAEGFDAT